MTEQSLLKSAVVEDTNQMDPLNETEIYEFEVVGSELISVHAGKKNYHHLTKNIVFFNN